MATKPASWLIAAACLLAAPLAWAASSVQVSDAWIRGIPPGMSVTAAYFTLRNEGNNARTLSSVSSPAFRAAEIHETVDRPNGASSMIFHASMDIDAGQVLRFKPHGRHVMLFDPKQAIRPGTQIPLIFTLWDGTRLEVMAEVRK